MLKFYDLSTEPGPTRGATLALLLIKMSIIIYVCIKKNVEMFLGLFNYITTFHEKLNGVNVINSIFTSGF